MKPQNFENFEENLANKILMVELLLGREVDFTRTKGRIQKFIPTISTKDGKIAIPR